jgi:hypothetical protein
MLQPNGFWGGWYERTFVDVRVFNPHSATSLSSNINSCYTRHEKEKKRSYEQRVREIEQASFTPIVLATTGGMAKQATIFYKRLATLLAYKREASYSQTVNWLRCRISFSLLRSSIQCIRGARSSYHHQEFSAPADLILSTTHPFNSSF